MVNEWWQPLRELNDNHFAGPQSGVSWNDHVDKLNNALGLSGDHALFTFPKPDLPPAWFIGDVTAMVPGEWCLVYSLNPAADNDLDFYAGREWDAPRFWGYQTDWLRNWWNPVFHSSLSVLAAACMGTTNVEEMDALKRFAAGSLVFAELCPYASRRFALSPEALGRLRETDIGCQVEARMADTMLREGSPKILLVNGNGAIEHFTATYKNALDWKLQRYSSEWKSEKQLWHMQGKLHLESNSIPVLGFPFLKKPRTHNAFVEIQQLGRFGAELIEATKP